MKKSKQEIGRGAITLGLGAIISKILGALYRIPLIGIIGGVGMGIYQMVFPVYTVLLELAGGAFPSAISKLIAGHDKELNSEKNRSLLKSALIICAILGGFFSCIMIVFSVPLANAQGDNRAYLSYIFLAPSVFFVGIISCYRGYFQGKMQMNPTAISQVIEQSVKLVLGLIFAYFLRKSIVLSAGGATLAVTFSEGIALLYLYLKYKRHGEKLPLKLDKETFKSNVKILIRYAVPITLIGIALPLSHVVDSFMIINIISGYRKDATSLFGLLSGAALTVIGLPVSVCYGLSTSAIPAVAGANELERRNKVSFALIITLIFSVAAAIATYVFAPLAVRILFRSMSPNDADMTIRLIRLLAPSVALLSLTQTANGALIGMSKIYSPLIGLVVGILVKILINSVLLPNPTLNVFGSAIAINACYFCTCLINFIIIAVNGVKNETAKPYYREYAN